MSYSGLLFDKISYKVRDADYPIYPVGEVESYLLQHYGAKEAVLDDVICVFHDDKHQGNILSVDTKYHNGDIWFGNENENCCLMLQSEFQVNHAARYEDLITFMEINSLNQSKSWSKEQILQDFEFKVKYGLFKDTKENFFAFLGAPGNIREFFSAHKQSSRRDKKIHFINFDDVRFHDDEIADAFEELGYRFSAGDMQKMIKTIREDNMQNGISIVEAVSKFIKQEDNNTLILMATEIQNRQLEQSIDNIVQITCEELGMTQIELANRIRVTENIVSGWLNGTIPVPDWAYVMFELLKKEKKLNANMKFI